MTITKRKKPCKKIIITFLRLTLFMIISLITRWRKLHESDWFLTMHLYPFKALFYQKVTQESCNLFVQLTKK